MTDVERLSRDYRAALLGYLFRRGEVPLYNGYQMGRSAVAARISLLELCRVHQEALLEVLQETAPEDLVPTVQAATDFFLEAVATYDMTQRRFLDDSAAVRADGGSEPA
jgi:hypothetical protein